MRQRRGGGDEAGGGDDYDGGKGKKGAMSDKNLLRILMGMVLAAPILCVVMIKMIMPNTDMEQLVSTPKMHHNLSQEEVRQNLRNHTLLHIGGLHRSGTTMIWEGLKLHPDVSGLQHQEKTDKRIAGWINRVFSEGLFLQRVYPKFGLDHDKFLLKKWIGQFAKKLPFVDETVFSWVRLREGVGRFALDPNNHLDESTPLCNEKAQWALFSQWSIFWDLERPVLLEKSPSNIVISPFLHRLWGLGLEDGASPGRFIFVRRHPIAVALATRRAGGANVNDLRVQELVENWVLAEERLKTDLQQYFEMGASATAARGKVYKVMTLEATLEAPRRVYEDLVAWLGLPANDAAAKWFEVNAQSDPNLKYFRHYCYGLMQGKNRDRRIEEHVMLVRKWADRVREIEPSYDLRNFMKTCHQALLGKKSVQKEAEEETLSEEELKRAEEHEAEVEANLEGKKRR